MNKEQIKKFVEENPSLVARRATQRPGVWVLKYKNRVFYKNLWTPELLECRGTIVDDDYNIIQRPFTKIFNRGENGTDIPRDEMVYWVRKINGFMACATWHDGDLFVSTTGSIDSEFADLAREWLDKPEHHGLFKEYPDLSFCFEIVDESDPHIVHETPGAYLLNARKKEWDSPQHELPESFLDVLAEEYRFGRPSWGINRFSDVVKMAKVIKHEGYVVYNADQSKELKLKTPYYLVTKFFGRMNNERFEKVLDNPNSIKPKIDEEFYSVIDFLAENREHYLSLDIHDRIVFVRKFLEGNIK